MNNIFKKVIAGVTTVALVATLLVGINITDSVKADDTSITLAKWSFTQGGQYNAGEPDNTAYINSVSMASGEVISGWLIGAGDAVNQTQSSTAADTGFTIDINGNGWDRTWSTKPWTINPWSIRASMENIAIEKGHTYTVSFNARASKIKNCYVTFGSEIEGAAPYGEAGFEGDKALIVLGTTEKTFTYTFTNWASVTKLNIGLMLGAFGGAEEDGKVYDYAGNLVDYATAEAGWKGQVYVSNLKVIDGGQHPDYVAPPERPTTQPQTEAPTVAPTQPQQNPTVAPTQPAKPPVVAKKLGKVKKVSAKNIKKGTVKITWKKVKNAKKYQVKVGKKTYKTNKVKLTVKKLKKGKKYTVKVRAMKRTGYKAGAWSKAVKVKIKK